MRRYISPDRPKERSQPSESKREQIVRVLMEEGYTKEEAEYMAGTVGDIQRPEITVE